MFYGECYKCGERWGLGTASTCKCEAEVASAPVLITSHPYFYKRPWVGLSTEEAREFYESDLSREELIHKIDEFLQEKNT